MALSLEKGQTTIVATVNGALATARPVRSEPKAKTTHLTSRLPRSCLPRSDEERRFIRGPNEQAVQKLFSDYRRDRGDPDDSGDSGGGDDELSDNLGPDNDDDDSDTEDHIPRKRYSYPREYKLAAINYFQTTWRKRKDGEYERLSVCRAAQRLKIDRKSLRCWILNKQYIINQPTGSRRACCKAPQTQG
jgi:hypothetical protein